MSSHAPGPPRGNLFTDVEGRLAAERVDVLVDSGTVRLERIISRGHTTPPGEWYDQDRDEWVVVLRGSAGLRFEGENGERVMHAGDLLASRQPPAIDLDNGGSGLAFPDTLAKAAAAVKNVDTIIPGHGPLMAMKDVEEYAQFNRDFRNAAVSGFNHGLSISDVADAWKVPDRYRGYTASPERVKANVQAIFSELTRSSVP
jgi:glyoxylase-like metal-dependent hydrolase (beta-lactamase superfamily II)